LEGTGSGDSLEPASQGAILRAEHVQKRFGGVHALRGADLELLPGEIHALVGENGSGKSTLLRIIGGHLAPDAGVLDVRAGSRIATVSQETTLAPDLSIAENILLGHRQVRRHGYIDWRATRQRAAEALARLDLDLDVSLPVRRLRPDQAQMVEIARALSTDARILILDEPTSSLTDDEVAALFRSLLRLREQGVATVFVSHRLNEIFELCDRVTTLRDGRTVGSGLVADTDHDELVSLMVGRALQDLHAEHADETSELVLRVRGLSSPDAFDRVDLDVARGEIVGLAGLVGAGRTQLLETLFGLHRASGSVHVGGIPVSYRSPADAIRDGVALVPADRKLQGLVLGRSVRDNLLMAVQSGYFRLRPTRAGREGAIATAIMNRLRIRAHSDRVPVATLSGGNQQKVLLGKWLQTGPRVLMLDEPTRGVDVGAKGEIYNLLFAARAQGLGILVSSSEAPELLTLCDRIVVMFRGRVRASLSRAEASEATIARLAGGHV
jgi:ABC-type sugar transport system ATPase subunit